jgi:trimeric autotransporter adhesin
MTDTTHADGTPAGNGRDNNPEKPNARVGRRKMILGVAAAGVGATVVAGAEPAGATDGNPVLIGEANTAKDTTSVTTKKGSGLEGETSDDTYSGVSGVDTSSGGGFGIYGSSTNGAGVAGFSSNGAGLTASSNNGPGVEGYTNTDDQTGVYGYDGSPGGGYAVGAFSENGSALYAVGNATVTGSLSKGGGSFKIDHPVDPAGKYLYHSFVESPDMMNVYNGTVTLDDKGQAEVELPHWFEALNRDYRYQLTAIGGPAPQLHISREVKDGTFSIAGGKRDQKVSWQVTGIRQDAWANANRIPIEVDKKAEDRGRYLHPELFGGEAITALARARGHRRQRHATGT